MHASSGTWVRCSDVPHLHPTRTCVHLWAKHCCSHISTTTIPTPLFKELGAGILQQQARCSIQAAACGVAHFLLCLGIDDNACLPCVEVSVAFRKGSRYCLCNTFQLQAMPCAMHMIARAATESLLVFGSKCLWCRWRCGEPPPGAPPPSRPLTQAACPSGGLE